MPPLSTASRYVGDCSSPCSGDVQESIGVLEGEPAVTQLATADQADPSSGKSNGEGFETDRQTRAVSSRLASEDEEQTRELV